MKRALNPRLGAAIVTLTQRVSGALVSRSCQRWSAVTAPRVWWLCGAVAFALVISFKVSAQQGGGASGYAPAAIRSVQSANALRCSPRPLKTALMLPPFGPMAVWRSQASSIEARLPFAISRVARVPT